MTYNQYKKQSVQDLKNYNYLKSSLETLPKRIEIMRKYPLPSASYAVISTGAHNKSADENLINYLAHIEHLENILAANRVKVNCMDAALAALSMKERELLASYYINRQRNTLNNLAYKSFTDRSSIYRRAQRALNKYILAYFGELPL